MDNIHGLYIVKAAYLPDLKNKPSKSKFIKFFGYCLKFALQATSYSDFGHVNMVAIIGDDRTV